MKASTVFMMGIAGIGLYYVWKLSQSAAGAVTGAANAATCGISSSIANLWNSLTLGSPMSVTGNVVLPNGSQVALNSLPVVPNCDGNVYVQYQGGVYQLGQSNSCGNWPATQVS